MRPRALLGLGALLGLLAAAALARTTIFPLSIFGRRLSPAWIRIDKTIVGATDLKQLYDRVSDREEFHAMVLMNELHGHIGPWSVLGCKMGMRAMDLLGADYLRPSAFSEAGDEQPGGAVTDGLALCAGCSLGQGNLRLVEGPTRLAATFLYQDRAVRLEIEPAVAASVRDSVAAIEARTGGPPYVQFWMQLRALGIQVWEEMNRREIFLESWVDPARITAVQDTGAARPARFSLAQNAPNPFNAATAISFDLPRPTRVALVVFDARGRRVCTLLSGGRPAGRTRVTWDGRDGEGRDAASGVYFYRLAADDGSVAVGRKMCLVR